LVAQTFGQDNFVSNFHAKVKVSCLLVAIANNKIKKEKKP